MANTNQQVNQQAIQNANEMERFKLKLTIWREAIPVYEGGTKLLSHFLQTCDRFAANLATNDDTINEALFALIKSKIRGEALDLVVTNNPATWAACRILLINRYSDPSSEDLLFNRLSTCHQQKNQTYEKYADEIKRRLSKLKEHVQLNNVDQSIIDTKNTFYDNVAKNTFINGILPPHRTFLTHFELNDIEACLAKCRQYDNHEQQAAFHDFIRQRESKPKSNIFGTTSDSRKINPFNTTGNTSSFGNIGNSRNNPFSNLPGTSKNINPFSSQTPPVAARMNFGNNAFRQNSPAQNYQPTPMSISTRNTNRPANNNFNRSNNLNIAQNNHPGRSNNNFTSNSNFQPRGNNFFKSTGPPNFISEELHHQQEMEEATNYQNDAMENYQEKLQDFTDFTDYQESLYRIDEPRDQSSEAKQNAWIKEETNNYEDSTHENHTPKELNTNSTDNLSKLPHIITTDPPLKILIDSGATSSIINPEIANKLFADYISPQNFEVKSIHKVTKGTHVLTYPILRELGDETPIIFLIMPWHSTYDCLIGHKDLERLEATINYRTHKFSTAKFTINYLNDARNESQITKESCLRKEEICINSKDEVKNTPCNQNNQNNSGNFDNKKCEKELQSTTSDISSRIEDNSQEDNLLSILPQTPDDAPVITGEINRMIHDDLAKIHIAEENETLSLPVTNKNIHAFNYSIIIKNGSNYQVKIDKHQLKVQYIVNINKNDMEAQLLKFFREYIKPGKQYGIYFTDKKLENMSYRILKEDFENKLKLTKTNTYTPKIDGNNFRRKLDSKNHTEMKKNKSLPFYNTLFKRQKEQQNLSVDSGKTFENKAVHIKIRRQKRDKTTSRYKKSLIEKQGLSLDGHMHSQEHRYNLRSSKRVRKISSLQEDEGGTTTNILDPAREE